MVKGFMQTAGLTGLWDLWGLASCGNRCGLCQKTTGCNFIHCALNSRRGRERKRELPEKAEAVRAPWYCHSLEAVSWRRSIAGSTQIRNNTWALWAGGGWKKCKGDKWWYSTSAVAPRWSAIAKYKCKCCSGLAVRLFFEVLQGVCWRSLNDLPGLKINKYTEHLSLMV